ncbi:ribosome biogenesis protein Nop53/GLTSCR2 [Globomyces pollinis-pini]|nr:ribosome biogenesis protein Nop53/GLTSCR2 [Globomyces pollinis-pini]
MSKDSKSIQNSKQPSRKGKKSWRKNVDIQDVEHQLDELRTEERLGGQIHQLPSTDLFFTDTLGDDNVRIAIKNKTLKIDELFTSTSKISPLVSKKSKNSTVNVDNGFKVRKISKIVKLKIERDALKKRKSGELIGSSLEAKANKRKEKLHSAKLKKGGFDLWGENELDNSIDPSNDYLEPTKPKKVKKPIVADSRPKSIPAVQIAHPGVSYNPSEEAHLAAIEIAAAVEFKKMEERDAILQDLSYPAELDLLEDETFFDDDENEDDITDQPEQVTELAMKKLPKAKTRQDLNRQKRHKELLAKEKAAKAAKALEKQLNKIQELEKEIASEATNKERLLTAKKELLALQDATRTKKLSRHKFRPKSMEIQLKDELADSLRVLKPEGNLIHDRFKSLEARNMIETRLPVKKQRRYKLKEVESHDYKRFK